MAYKTNVFITKEDDWYVANSLETNVTSQGKTIEEAVANLKEALELYFEDNVNTNINNTQSFITSLEVVV